MCRTHQRLALAVKSQWKPLFSQEGVFSNLQLFCLRRKKGVSFTFRPLFLSFSWPGVGIETESKQSGSDSISYLNAHIVWGKTVISHFSLLCTKLPFPGAHHRWRYKVLAFWRHCLEYFFLSGNPLFSRSFVLVVNLEKNPSLPEGTRPQCRKLAGFLIPSTNTHSKVLMKGETGERCLCRAELPFSVWSPTKTQLLV